jgi:alpha-tubulin suppressor-like RCC1 family protein
MPLNEGQTVQYTVTTTRVADGTVLYWKTTGNTTNSDIVGGNTGSVTITNNQGVFNLTPTLDLSMDGTKTLGISISTGSVNGPTVVSTANPIIVEDTSLPPAARLYSWGNNTQGKLGLNNTTYKSSPTQVGTNNNWSDISIGNIFSAGTKTDGTLWTWGNNGTGQLGLNTRNNYAPASSPTQVGASTNWSSVVVSSGNDTTAFTGAIKTNGTLWMWGDAGSFKLGTGYSSEDRSSPVQVGALTTWSQLSLGASHAAAVRGDGTLWLWGSNDSGQTGFNTNSGEVMTAGSQASPRQLGTGTDWRSVSCGQAITSAIKTNGTLWMWGAAAYGRLGQGDSISMSSPVQVGTNTNWSMTSNKLYHTMAIKTDGTLWGWGSGTRGQLGQGAQVNANSPIQIGAGTNWSKIATNSHFTIATKTDGTLWGWGRNREGALGLNSSGNYNYITSPVQIGSDINWNTISAGNFCVLATTSN